MTSPIGTYFTYNFWSKNIALRMVLSRLSLHDASIDMRHKCWPWSPWVNMLFALAGAGSVELTGPPLTVLTSSWLRLPAADDQQLMGDGPVNSTDRSLQVRFTKSGLVSRGTRWRPNFLWPFFNSKVFEKKYTCCKNGYISWLPEL